MSDPAQPGADAASGETDQTASSEPTDRSAPLRETDQTASSEPTDRSEATAETDQEASSKPAAQASREAPHAAALGTPLMAPGWAWACMVATGVLYFAAFAPQDLWPAALITFVPMRLGLEGRKPKQAALMGLAAGSTMVGLGFAWLVGMLQTFSGFPLPLCILFATIVCLYQGGRSAMLGWIFARAAERGYAKNLVFALAFVASELLYPLLFPWYFSSTTHNAIVFQQLSDIGGPILAGLPLVLFSCALAEIIATWLRRRRGERSARPSKSTLWAGALALALQLGYGALRIAQIDAQLREAPELKVGMVQGNLGLMQKRTDAREALRRHQRATHELKAQGAELVVWSESSVSHAVEESRAFAEIQRNITGSLGVPSVVGTLIWRRDPKHDMTWMFNTAVSADASGKVNARYDKHYLLMFGEYLPLGKQFPILHKWSPNSGRFSPGESVDPLLMEHNGQLRKLTTLICYEDILPGFTNRAVRVGKPDLLINMTNDAWFGDTAEPWEHLALAKGRAVEHRRYLVRSTNSGVSAIIDPLGRTVVQTELFKEQTALATVHWMNSQTLYSVLGDTPWYAASLAVFIACFRAHPRLRKQRRAA